MFGRPSVYEVPHVDTDVACFIDFSKAFSHEGYYIP